MNYRPDQEIMNGSEREPAHRDDLDDSIVRERSAQSTSSSGISRRTTLTILTAVGLTGLYSVYRRTVVPMIEPASIHSKRQKIEVVPWGTGSAENRQMAEKYLPNVPWAATAEYQIATKDAYLYFKEFEPLDSDDAFEQSDAYDEIRCRPVAIIWKQGQGSAEDEAPVTVVSDTAYVKFSGTIGATNPDPGRIVGAALGGPVAIDGADGLSIRGHNFFFQRTRATQSNSGPSLRVWSDEDIEFAYGPHVGQAHGLQVELIPRRKAPKSDTLAISGIESIQLLRNVKMNLIQEEDQDEPRDVWIQSAGRFTFDLRTNVATFEDDVDVLSRKRADMENVDSLQCDRLMLLFEPKEPEPENVAQHDSQPVSAPETDASIENTPPPNASGDNPSAASNAKFQGIRNDLVFRRMRAEGSAIRSVVVASTDNDLRARLSVLTYDAKTGQADLSDPESVQVFQKTSEMRSPRITLLHNEDGDITDIHCWGAGWMKHIDAVSSEIDFAAQWSKQLWKHPDEDSDLDVIELDERVLVRRPQQLMGLAAEHVKIWIDPIDSNDATSSNGSGDDQIENFRPRRVLAEQNVVMISPEMEGKTNRLELYFEDEPPAVQNRNVRPAARSATRRDASDGAIQPASNSNDADSNGPVKIVSDLIRVRLVQSESEPQPKLAEVWTTGNVRVKQATEPGKKPIVMTGDLLHIENRSKTEQLIDIHGAPAHIIGDQLHIEGNDLKLDRARNLAWVEGPGVLEVPVDRNLEGDKLAKPEMMEVWWTEKMTFDGKTARFFGEVQSVLQDSVMRCEEMNVELTERISFSEQANDDTKRELQSVTCAGSVQFESKTYENNIIVANRRGNFAEFSLNQVSGETKALGPGRIWEWRRGRGNRAGMAPAAMVKANAALAPDETEWEYTRILFAGRMQGNTKQRVTTFHDRVKILYGPVDDPTIKIDPENLPKGAGTMSCHELQITQIKKGEKDKGHIEVLGRGNAELEGRYPVEDEVHSFWARSDEIAYDESKEQYVLRAFGKQVATIWRQTKVGAPRSKSEAKRMSFFPSRNALELDGAVGLDGLQ